MENSKPVSEEIKNKLKKFKTVGIIVSIIMVALGIAMFCIPAKTAVLIAWLTVVGIVVYGIFQIVRYVKTPEELRNGWMLASGIIGVVFGVLLIINAVGIRVSSQIPGLATFPLMEMIAYCVGFYAIFAGISQLCLCGQIKKAGGSSGWAIASGILNLILGIIIICSPILGFFTVEFVFGIYLVVFGIALFAELCSGGGSKKAA